MKLFTHRDMYTVLILIIVIIGTSLWFMYVSIRPVKFISDTTPNDLGMQFEDVTFETNDDLTLGGWFIPSEQEKAKTIILLHGYPADKGNILPALAFLHMDYNLFLFDFRYFGQSEGSYSTAGAKEIEDLRAAISYLKERGIEEVGVWGFSMGGAVALMTQAHAPEIKVIIAESSYARLDKMIPWFVRWPTVWAAKLFIGIDARKVSPVESASKTSIPLLIIHSTGDTVIPFSHAQTIQAALNENPKAEFWFTEELLHGQITDEHQERIAEFLERNL